MPTECRTRKKKDGEKYVICYDSAKPKKKRKKAKPKTPRPQAISDMPDDVQEAISGMRAIVGQPANPERVGRPLWDIEDEIAMLHSGGGPHALPVQPPRPSRSSVAILRDYRQKHSYGYPLKFRPPTG
jgi:hypothetical protein